MTTTETLHPELTADLVERVANLSPEAQSSLSTFLERERELEAEYQREVWAEIRRRSAAYDRGEEKAHDWDDVVVRIEAKMAAMTSAVTSQSQYE